MIELKQMSREELKNIGTAEALNEILDRNTRLAAAKKIIREIKAMQGDISPTRPFKRRIQMTGDQFMRKVAKAISNAETPEDAAKATFDLCCKAAEAWGMKPSIECSIKKPGEPRHHSDESCWCVTFEAGPYEWGVTASLSVSTKGKVLAEPYYSFDLCFSEA
jgi:hypothetical protein